MRPTYHEASKLSTYRILNRSDSTMTYLIPPHSPPPYPLQSHPSLIAAESMVVRARADCRTAEQVKRFLQVTVGLSTTPQSNIVTDIHYNTTPYPTLPYSIVPYPTLRYATLLNRVLPYPIVPYPTLPYPTLPCYPTLHCTLFPLPYPITPVTQSRWNQCRFKRGPTAGPAGRPRRYRDF